MEGHKHYGKPMPGVPKRESQFWFLRNMQTWYKMLLTDSRSILNVWRAGYSVGNGMADHLEQNLKFAETGKEFKEWSVCCEFGYVMEVKRYSDGNTSVVMTMVL